MPFLITRGGEMRPTDYGIMHEPSYDSDRTLRRDPEIEGWTYPCCQWLTWSFTRIDPDWMPKTLTFDFVLDPQPDFEKAGRAGFVWLLSERTCDIIDALEPGVHQFIPVETFGPDGAPTPTRYRFLIVQQHGFTVDVYRSPRIEITPTEYEGLSYAKVNYMKRDGTTDLVHRAERVGSMHLWVEISGRRVGESRPVKFDLIPDLMVSDTLMAKIIEAGLTGYDVMTKGVLDTEWDAGRGTAG